MTEQEMFSLHHAQEINAHASLAEIISATLTDLAFKVSESGKKPVALPEIKMRYTRREQDPQTQEWVNVECPMEFSDTFTVYAEVMCR